MGKDSNNRNTQARENLKKYLESLNQQVENDEALSSLYADFIGHLNDINDATDRLYERDSQGNLRPFTKEDQQDLLDSYNEALFELYRLQTEIDPDQTELRDITNKLQDLLNTDVTSLTAVAADDEKSIADTLEEGRAIRVDVTGKEFSTVGAESSSRMAMTVVQDGKEQNGFFTKEKLYNPGLKGPEIDAVIEENKKALPKYADFLDYVKNKFAEGMFDSMNIANAYEEEHPEFPSGDLMQVCEKVSTHPSIKNLYDEQELMVYQYGGDTGLDAKPGDSISGRNVAMSNMANLFGVPDIIAKATAMELSDENGNITKGVFMENAKGIDRDNIMPEQVANCPENCGDNPSLLKNIAELQMLDYICGNVDRHQNNFFYQFSDDGTQLIGIQGIDNDFSFGRKVSDGPRTAGLQEIDVNNIDVITESMGNKIILLDESMVKLSLRGTGLSEEDIDATITRINNVKQRIAQKKIELVPDDQWSNRTLDGLAKGKRGHSLFWMVNSQVESLQSIAKGNLAAAERKAAKAAQEPEKKAFKFEKVEKVDGINKASMDIDARKATEFSVKMSQSQKKIVGKGSDEFRNVENAVNKYSEMLAGLGDNPSTKDYLKLQTMQEEIIRLSDQYLAKKNGKDLNKNGKIRYSMMQDIKSYYTRRNAEFKDAVRNKEERELAEDTERVKAQIESAVADKALEDQRFLGELNSSFADFVKDPRPDGFDIKTTNFTMAGMGEALSEMENFACTRGLQHIGSSETLTLAQKLNKVNSREEFNALLNDTQLCKPQDRELLIANADLIYECIENDKRELPNRQSFAREILDNIKYPDADRESLEATANKLGTKIKDASGDQQYLDNVQRLREIQKNTLLRSYGTNVDKAPRWAKSLYRKPNLSDAEKQIIDEGINNPQARGKLYDLALKELASIDVDNLYKDKTIEEHIDSFENDGYLWDIAWDSETLFEEIGVAMDKDQYHGDRSVVEQTKVFTKSIMDHVNKYNMIIDQYERPYSMVMDIEGDMAKTVELMNIDNKEHPGLISEDERQFCTQQFNLECKAIKPREEVEKNKYTMDLTNSLAAEAQKHNEKARELFTKIEEIGLKAPESTKLMNEIINERAEYMYYNAPKLNAAKMTQEDVEAYLKPENKAARINEIKTASMQTAAGMTLDDFEKALFADEVDAKDAQHFRDILGKNRQLEKAQKEAQKEAQKNATKSTVKQNDKDIVL